MKETTMDISNKEKIIIFWQTRDEEALKRIRKRFGIPKYTTLNGVTPALLKAEDKALFDETANRGFFRYRHTDWTFNGKSYSW